MRIHPAASRVEKLATDTPARLIVFDLLCDTAGNSLLPLPLKERRRRLMKFDSEILAGSKYFRLSPATFSLEKAQKWLASAGSSLDGLIAKRLNAEYRPG